jgi:hypothetical protein
LCVLDDGKSANIAQNRLFRYKEESFFFSSYGAVMGALNIKDAEVAKKARQLAKLKGTTITAAVGQALDASLAAATRMTDAEREDREKRVDEILARIRASIPPDAPSYEEIMDDMYDENGLPK